MMPDSFDCREFVLAENIDFKVVLYQAEIKRLIKILNSMNCVHLADKFLRVIYIRDVKENTKTHFNGDKCTMNIAKFIMSPKDYREYIANQREMDNMMRRFYGRKI